MFISILGIQDEQDNCVGAVNNLVSITKKYLYTEIKMKQHYILEINWYLF